MESESDRDGEPEGLMLGVKAGAVGGESEETLAGWTVIGWEVLELEDSGEGGCVVLFDEGSTSSAGPGVGLLLSWVSLPGGVVSKGREGAVGLTEVMGCGGGGDLLGACLLAGSVAAGGPPVEPWESLDSGVVSTSATTWASVG